MQNTILQVKQYNFLHVLLVALEDTNVTKVNVRLLISEIYDINVEDMVRNIRYKNKVLENIQFNVK